LGGGPGDDGVGLRVGVELDPDHHGIRERTAEAGFAVKRPTTPTMPRLPAVSWFEPPDKVV
jgi:hypothetical protein